MNQLIYLVLLLLVFSHSYAPDVNVFGEDTSADHACYLEHSLSGLELHSEKALFNADLNFNVSDESRQADVVKVQSIRVNNKKYRLLARRAAL